MTDSPEPSLHWADITVDWDMARRGYRLRIPHNLSDHEVDALGDLLDGVEHSAVSPGTWKISYGGDISVVVDPDDFNLGTLGGPLNEVARAAVHEARRRRGIANKVRTEIASGVL